MLPPSSTGQRSLSLPGELLSLKYLEPCLMQVLNRAHPSVPNKPPFETLVGFLAAPVDKLKDMFAKFPTEEMKEEAAKHEHAH